MLLQQHCNKNTCTAKHYTLQSILHSKHTPSWLQGPMPYRELIAVCSEIHTKHINTLFRQNVEFLNIKSRGMQSNHMVLKG